MKSRSKEYARSTLVLWVLWFTVVFLVPLWHVPLALIVMVMKGFSMIQSFEYVLIMTLAQLPGYYSAAWLIERMGRKFVLVTYLLGTVFQHLYNQPQNRQLFLLFPGILLSFFEPPVSSRSAFVMPITWNLSSSNKGGLDEYVSYREGWRGDPGPLFELGHLFIAGYPFPTYLPYFV